MNMKRFFPLWPLFLLFFILNACAVKQEDTLPAPLPESDEAMTEDIKDLVEEQDGQLVIEQCKKADNGISRDQCFRYSATLKTITANEPPQGNTTKTIKKSSTTKSGKKVEKIKKVVVSGRCQPQ